MLMVVMAIDGSRPNSRSEGCKRQQQNLQQFRSHLKVCHIGGPHRESKALRFGSKLKHTANDNLRSPSFRPSPVRSPPYLHLLLRRRSFIAAHSRSSQRRSPDSASPPFPRPRSSNSTPSPLLPPALCPVLLPLEKSRTFSRKKTPKTLLSCTPRHGAHIVEG